MVTAIVFWVLAILSPPSRQEVAALRGTAPDLMTTEQASEHLLAARAAGLVHGFPPELLLSIAHHESRYQPGEVTREPGGLVSCGVMTPVPKHRCHPWELTIVGGYDAGAAHLALWRTYFSRSYLTAYAGGGVLVHSCATGSKNPACDIPRQFTSRARAIGNALRSAGVRSGT